MIIITEKKVQEASRDMVTFDDFIDKVLATPKPGFSWGSLNMSLAGSTRYQLGSIPIKTIGYQSAAGLRITFENGGYLVLDRKEIKNQIEWDEKNFQCVITSTKGDRIWFSW
jgi:hypothetical protein